MPLEKPKSGSRKEITVTRADIAKSISEDTGLNVQASELLVLSLLGHISNALIGGEDVKVSGFGAFQLKDKAARRGRNPATGAPKMIAARRVVTFKPSDILRNRVAARPVPKDKP